jgi:hypothetical protein
MGSGKTPFLPKANEEGNSLLWSAHKDDLIEMDDPEDPTQRILVAVAKMREGRVGVVPIFDARGTTKTDPNGIRKMWEKGISFFKNQRANRVITNELGKIIFKFPRLN